MERKVKEFVIKTVSSKNPTLNDILQVINLYALDKTGKEIPWDQIHPLELQTRAMSDPRISQAYQDARRYFEIKWELLSLPLDKGTLYVEHSTGLEYRP